jgi:taurine transport system permease protein
MLRTLEGFGIALLGAALLGLLGATIKPFQVVLRPTMIVFKSAPTAAFVFLFFVLFGGKEAPIFVVSLLALPILYESIVAGFNNIPVEIEDSLKVDSGKNIRGLFKVKIPIAMPFFMVGLASSFALSLKMILTLITFRTDNKSPTTSAAIDNAFMFRPFVPGCLVSLCIEKGPH